MTGRECAFATLSGTVSPACESDARQATHAKAQLKKAALHSFAFTAALAANLPSPRKLRFLGIADATSQSL